MKKTCKQKATEYVNKTAAAGALLAPVPVPFMGTAGLITLESGLVYWIARIYGEKLSNTDVAHLVSALGVGSVGIKFGVMEALNFVPIAGWLLKAPLAASVIKGIGEVAIRHFEDMHPGMLYTRDPDVEKT